MVFSIKKFTVHKSNVSTMEFFIERYNILFPCTYIKWNMSWSIRHKSDQVNTFFPPISLSVSPIFLVHKKDASCTLRANYCLEAKQLYPSPARGQSKEDKHWEANSRSVVLDLLAIKTGLATTTEHRSMTSTETYRLILLFLWLRDICFTGRGIITVP